jgi:hypothetical protein
MGVVKNDGKILTSDFKVAIKDFLKSCLNINILC